jgi:hypothetical protein
MVTYRRTVAGPGNSRKKSPQELPGSRWRNSFAFDLTWSTTTTHCDRRRCQLRIDDPRAPSTINNTAALGWHNQTVVAAGLTRPKTQTASTRANYGRNPIPANTVNPLLAAIVSSTLLPGLRIDWTIVGVTGAPEYLLPKVTYNNPAPFGGGAGRVSYVPSYHAREW